LLQHAEAVCCVQHAATRRLVLWLAPWTSWGSNIVGLSLQLCCFVTTKTLLCSVWHRQCPADALPTDAK